MKVSSMGLLLLGAAARAAGLGLELTLDDSYSFEEFLVDHGKGYADPEEYRVRESIFLQNLHEIIRHNSDGSNTYRKAVNKFADWSREEFLRLLGYRPVNRQRHPAPAFAASERPEVVDWREKSALTPIKNQGACGSCWTFGSTESLESALFMQHGKLLELSEQAFVSCTPNDKHCGGIGGCEGGIIELVFDYAMDQGVYLEADYAYEARDGVCRLNRTGLQPVATLDGFVDLPENDFEATMQAVAKQPIPVNLDASAFAFYSSGVFDETHCGTDINHVVQLVGYGTDEESGEAHYTIRNSWGPDWGESGFMRIRQSSACATDTTPQDGTGCKDGPSEVTVCGSCGILYQNAYPKTLTLTAYGESIVEGVAEA